MHLPWTSREPAPFTNAGGGATSTTVALSEARKTPSHLSSSVLSGGRIRWEIRNYVDPKVRMIIALPPTLSRALE